MLANIAIVITGESSPALASWFTWRDLLHLIDLVCCCAILFPLVWHIKNLRDAAHTDGKAARNLEKLVLFRRFYILVVSYVYFTRIGASALPSPPPPSLSPKPATHAPLWRPLHRCCAPTRPRSPARPCARPSTHPHPPTHVAQSSSCCPPRCPSS